MKKTLYAVAASALFSIAGLAGAAEPLQLSENQMDNVSAGWTSVASGSSWALLGSSVSTSGTSATQVSVLPPLFAYGRTEATTFNFASGVLAITSSSAGSSL